MMAPLLRTMVFGRTMIAPVAIDIEAIRHAVPPRDSDELYLALRSGQSPGSWLPFGKEQIVRSAEPYRACQRRLPSRFTSGVSTKVCFERELLDHSYSRKQP
jgi:hypothetical protein